MEQIEEREQELKEKRICRFCMTQNEPLFDILSIECKTQSKITLPMQILSVSSIEVDPNSTLPCLICENCHILVDYCYRFKQACQTSDNKLKQYPLTGRWPNALDVPIVPSPPPPPKELVDQSVQTTAPTPIKRPAPPETQSTLKKPKLEPGAPKILNKSPKILNKNPLKSDSVKIKEPIVKTDAYGNVEIYTEVVETSEYIRDEEREEEPTETVETNVFPCPYCERTYPLKQLLDLHVKNHERNREFECERCPKRFFNKNDLVKHMTVHTGDKPFKCVACGKCFSRSTLLYRHEKIHIDQPRFLCVYCERPFLSRDELQKHTEIHKKKRPFKCEVCGKGFAYKQGMERHMVCHSREHPYKCEHCPQTFMTPSKLARHLTQHAGDRPYPCKLCPKKFLLSHHLTRHLRSNHGQGSAPTYKCSDCSKEFKSRDELIYHSAVHAMVNLTCPLCKLQFNDLDAVTDHIRQHSVGEQFSCDYCDLIYTTSDMLEEHCLNDHAEDHRGNEINIKTEYIVSNVSEDGMEIDNGTEFEEGYVIEELVSAPPPKKSNPTEQKVTVLSDEPVNMLNTNQNSDGEVQILAEFEVRKSNRSKRSGDNMQGEFISPDILNSEEEDAEYQDFSGDDNDGDFIITDIIEDEDSDGETKPKTYKSLPKKVDKPSPVVEKTVKKLPIEKNQIKVEKTKEIIIPPPPKPEKGAQDKITKFLQKVVPAKSDKVIEKPKNENKVQTVENVLKNLPKGINIVKSERSDSTPKKLPVKLVTSTPVATSSKVSSQKVPSPKDPSPKVPSPKKVSKPPTPKEKESPKNVVSTGPKITKTTIVSNSNSKPTTSSPDTQKSTSPSNENAKSITAAAVAASVAPPKFCEMKIGDKMVKVQKLKMTKEQVEIMKREGKIETKADGTIILKNSSSPQSSTPKSTTGQRKIVKPVSK